MQSNNNFHFIANSNRKKLGRNMKFVRCKHCGETATVSYWHFRTGADCGCMLNHDNIKYKGRYLPSHTQEFLKGMYREGYSLKDISEISQFSWDIVSTIPGIENDKPYT